MSALHRNANLFRVSRPSRTSTHSGQTPLSLIALGTIQSSVTSTSTRSFSVSLSLYLTSTASLSVQPPRQQKLLAGLTGLLHSRGILLKFVGGGPKIQLQKSSAARVLPLLRQHVTRSMTRQVWLAKTLDLFMTSFACRALYFRMLSLPAANAPQQMLLPLPVPTISPVFRCMRHGVRVMALEMIGLGAGHQPSSQPFRVQSLFLNVLQQPLAQFQSWSTTTSLATH